MKNKIASLKKAYQSGDRARIIKAARSLLAYDKKHPFASVLGGDEYVRLAARIVAEF